MNKLDKRNNRTQVPHVKNYLEYILSKSAFLVLFRNLITFEKLSYL